MNAQGERVDGLLFAAAQRDVGHLRESVRLALEQGQGWEGTKIMNETKKEKEMEGMGQQTCCVRSQLGQPETMQSSNSVSAREATNDGCGRQGATHQRSA